MPSAKYVILEKVANSVREEYGETGTITWHYSEQEFEQSASILIRITHDYTIEAVVMIESDNTTAIHVTKGYYVDEHIGPRIEEEDYFQKTHEIIVNTVNHFIGIPF